MGLRNMKNTKEKEKKMKIKEGKHLSDCGIYNEPAFEKFHCTCGGWADEPLMRFILKHKELSQYTDYEAYRAYRSDKLIEFLFKRIK